jgi:hypothetical protein
MTLTIVSIIFLGVALIWSLVDARQIGSADVWMKPLKFALSSVVLLETISLVEQRLSATVRSGWQLRVTGWVMAAAFLSEKAYVTHQAALAEPSHYNSSTSFHAFMYQVVMGGRAVVLVLGVAVIGWIVQRDRKADSGDVLRAGIFAGFVLTYASTMTTAGYLSANGGHFVGEHAVGAPVIPLSVGPASQVVFGLPTSLRFTPCRYCPFWEFGLIAKEAQYQRGPSGWRRSHTPA